MSPPGTLEEDLAREVREAIARASPAGASATGAESGAPPDPVRLAADHLTPSIPDGARLGAVKRAFLRLSRFLWREQTSFNALVLEGFRRLRQEWDGRFGAFAEATGRELSESRRRAAVQEARFAEIEAAGPRAAEPSARRAAPSGGADASDPTLPDAVYALFEERFRGDPQRIAAAQRFYVSFLRGAPGPVLDAGCGRGEFLRLLAAEGIPASGVDTNPVSVRLCRDEGLAVEAGDAREALAAIPPGSLGGVVAFQVVEHWPANRVFAFLREARRALAPGGVLIAESVNTDSLAALRAFFLDPTHVRPVPPAALAFLAEAAGFAEVRIEYPAALPPAERLAEASENDAKLNRLLFGPPDYAVIARVPRA